MEVSVAAHALIKTIIMWILTFCYNLIHTFKNNHAEPLVQRDCGGNAMTPFQRINSVLLWVTSSAGHTTGGFHATILFSVYLIVTIN
jgi:hypothetical protein